MKDYVSLSEIQAKPIKRISTGEEEFDFIYGYSRFPTKTVWGIPVGKISIWAGASGTGKSRLAIQIAKNLVESGLKVLYFQTESDLEDFAGWVGGTENYDNFFCSGESSVSDMIRIIENVRPHVVFVDSVNEVDEFITGHKSEARRLINGENDKINGENDKMGFRQACNNYGCHVVLLGQLNQDGTIKGGTSLPHLVDIALNIEKYPNSFRNCFKVSVGIKHRYGRQGKDIFNVWMHRENDVMIGSIQRLKDKIWCETHGRVYEEEESGNELMSAYKAGLAAHEADKKKKEPRGDDRGVAERIFDDGLVKFIYDMF